MVVKSFPSEQNISGGFSNIYIQKEKIYIYIILYIHTHTHNGYIRDMNNIYAKYYILYI